MKNPYVSSGDEMQIDKLIGENTYITTQKLLKIVISKSWICRSVTQGDLVRISRGIYSMGVKFNDVMFLIHNKYASKVDFNDTIFYINEILSLEM